MLRSYLWKTFRLAFAMIVAILLVRTFVVETGRVNGVSMEPTYVDDQTFLVNKFALLFSPPERGQVVQLRDPSGAELLLKRVIGLPRESVRIHGNEVSVVDANGNTIILNETYLKPGSVTQAWNNGTGEYPILGPNEYFVMGDNRRESVDSRHFGPVPREKILGSAFSPF